VATVAKAIGLIIDDPVKLLTKAPVEEFNIVIELPNELATHILGPSDVRASGQLKLYFDEFNSSIICLLFLFISVTAFPLQLATQILLPTCNKASGSAGTPTVLPTVVDGGVVVVVVGDVVVGVGGVVVVVVDGGLESTVTTVVWVTDLLTSVAVSVKV
jgi:hypothetical protein